MRKIMKQYLKSIIYMLADQYSFSQHTVIIFNKHIRIFFNFIVLVRLWCILVQILSYSNKLRCYINILMKKYRNQKEQKSEDSQQLWKKIGKVQCIDMKESILEFGDQNTSLEFEILRMNSNIKKSKELVSKVDTSNTKLVESMFIDIENSENITEKMKNKETYKVSQSHGTFNGLSNSSLQNQIPLQKLKKLSISINQLKQTSNKFSEKSINDFSIFFDWIKITMRQQLEYFAQIEQQNRNLRDKCELLANLIKDKSLVIKQLQTNLQKVNNQLSNNRIQKKYSVIENKNETSSLQIKANQETLNDQYENLYKSSGLRNSLRLKINRMRDSSKQIPPIRSIQTQRKSEGLINYNKYVDLKNKLELLRTEIQKTP